jgi:hypothetical protein
MSLLSKDEAPPNTRHGLNRSIWPGDPSPTGARLLRPYLRGETAWHMTVPVVAECVTHVWRSRMRRSSPQCRSIQYAGHTTSDGAREADKKSDESKACKKRIPCRRYRQNTIRKSVKPTQTRDRYDKSDQPWPNKARSERPRKRPGIGHQTRDTHYQNRDSKSFINDLWVQE